MTHPQPTLRETQVLHAADCRFNPSRNKKTGQQAGFFMLRQKD